MLKITVIDNFTPFYERLCKKFKWIKQKPKSKLNQKAYNLIIKMHGEGHSVITMMCEINALCGMSLKENDVAHALGEMWLPLPKISRDKETPVP